MEAAPKGHFVVVDMSTDGDGEWKKWQRASFFGADFIWTSLHDFGGTDGIKGDLGHANEIPFAGLAPNPQTTVVGSGYSPEGIDQNPAYYEFVSEANFRSVPVSNITHYMQARAHRRYALTSPEPSLSQAWALLVAGAYSQDLSVRDGTGVPHLPGTDTSQFLPDRYTPGAKLCSTFQAWQLFLNAAAGLDPATVALEPFRYDLVNLGREVLAQLSTPMSNNFSDAFSAPQMDASAVKATGNVYINLLTDLDELVGCDSAFLLGPWLETAKAWGRNNSDCGAQSCVAFYEWNARSQLTTWNPATSNATKVPAGPVDYASKHWNGLIHDYYAARARQVQTQALLDAAAGRALNQTAVDQLEATLAYSWQNANTIYPSKVTGPALAFSKAMLNKYGHYFSACN